MKQKFKFYLCLREKTVSWLKNNWLLTRFDRILVHCGHLNNHQADVCLGMGYAMEADAQDGCQVGKCCNLDTPQVVEDTWAGNVAVEWAGAESCLTQWEAGWLKFQPSGCFRQAVGIWEHGMALLSLLLQPLVLCLLHPFKEVFILGKSSNTTRPSESWRTCTRKTTVLWDYCFCGKDEIKLLYALTHKLNLQLL